MKWEKIFDWSGNTMNRVESCEQKFKELLYPLQITW